jgi:hypothetical protein
VGWINFAPTHGGVKVYDDHLEGYAWGENTGWIRLGSDGGGGSPYYANTTKDDYGVNRDSDGSLSGYAWGTNVGWINFSPAHGAVTIDLWTGRFDGYAWGENTGWIHFKNEDPAYNVVTSFRPLPIGGVILSPRRTGVQARGVAPARAVSLGLVVLVSLAVIATAVWRRAGAGRPLVRQAHHRPLRCTPFDCAQGGPVGMTARAALGRNGGGCPPPRSE